MITLNVIVIAYTIIVVTFLREWNLLNCVYPTYSNNKYVLQTTGEKQQQISNVILYQKKFQGYKIGEDYL